MDVKCIRILRPYKDEDNNELTIYIDEQARESLSKQWGDEVEVLGRKKAIAKIKPLNEIDQDGFIGRAGQKLIDDVYIEYGEEVFINNIS